MKSLNNLLTIFYSLSLIILFLNYDVGQAQYSHSNISLSPLFPIPKR